MHISDRAIYQLRTFVRAQDVLLDTNRRENRFGGKNGTTRFVMLHHFPIEAMRKHRRKWRNTSTHSTVAFSRARRQWSRVRGVRKLATNRPTVTENLFLQTCEESNDTYASIQHAKEMRGWINWTNCIHVSKGDFQKKKKKKKEISRCSRLSNSNYRG